MANSEDRSETEVDDQARTVIINASDAGTIRVKSLDEAGIARRAATHRNAIFAICGLALCMTAIDATIVSTAVPRIGRAFHSTLNWTAWTVTIYQLGMVFAMPLAGKLSDQFGRKRIFLICTCLFTVSSLACGLSTSIEMLIPLRFIQSLGGGAMFPSAAGIISDHFGQNRDRALGLLTSIPPIGGSIGPLFGAVIVQFWNWRGIFFVNIPIGIVLIVLTVRCIPRTKPKGAARFDVGGAVLLAGTIFAGMLMITELGEKNASFLRVPVIVSAVATVVLGRTFMRHIRRHPSPAISPHLLTGKGFAAMNLVNFMYGAAAQGFAVLVFLYAETRYSLSLTTVSTLFTARSVALIAVTAAAAMAMRRTGYPIPMISGFLLTGVGLGMIAIAPRLGLPPYPWLLLSSMITGIGLGFATPSTNNATLQLAPDQVGAISGLRGTFRLVGTIIYLSIATSLIARASDPIGLQSHLFAIQAAGLVVTAGLVFLVPDHKGRW